MTTGPDRPTPPSFAPATAGARPARDDVQVVGSQPSTEDAQPTHLRVPRTASDRPQTPAGGEVPRKAPRSVSSGSAVPAAPADPARPRQVTSRSVTSPGPSPATSGGRPVPIEVGPRTGTPAPSAAGAPAAHEPGAEGRPIAVPGRPRTAGAPRAARQVSSNPAQARATAAAGADDAARSTSARSTSARPAPAAARTVASHPGARRPAPARTASPTPPAPPTKRHRRRRVVVAVVALLLVAAVAWPVGLVFWANGKIHHTQALSGASGTGGATYLITGSDQRGGDGVEADGTTGARTDTIMVLQVPDSGPVALISLPRDTYVDVPGHGPAKLNAAFAWGGAPLLVKTVEQITGLTIGHYAEIGMGGVKEVVDAVGGVNLCWDADVNDEDSGMVWTAGCHDVDGDQALAFSRMRKSDPTGDIGRGLRQRQLVSAVMAKVDPASLVWHPDRQVALIDAGTGALTVDEHSSILDLARLALAFKAANGPDGITGTPPIKSLDYRPGKVGSTVLLDPEASPAFWDAIRNGTLQPGSVGGVSH